MKIAIGILKYIAWFLGLIIVYLSIVTLGPGFDISEPVVKKDPPAQAVPSPPPIRRNVNFDVNGSRISAFLYLPLEFSEPVPVVVMAHGFGGTKDFILENYAVRFREAGIAVLTFDYRFMGESEGEPRQLIWLPYQLEDVEAAVSYIRGLQEIDPARVALWGTSLGGGHVMMLAAQDNKIAAVVAQVPFLDPGVEPEESNESAGQLIQLVMHAQRDMVRSRFNMEPHRIPIFGKPGTISMMNTPDAFEEYLNLAPLGYINRVCARVILRASFYRPVDTAHEIKAPVLIQIADRDSLLQPHAADETIMKLGPLAEVKHYDAAHFGIYSGAHFEQSSADQVAFFRKHLFGERME